MLAIVLHARNSILKEKLKTELNMQIKKFLDFYFRQLYNILKLDKCKIFKIESYLMKLYVKKFRN